MNLTNKTALITGACGGIGTAITQALQKEGVNCLLVDRLDFKTELPYFKCDLSKHLEIEGLEKWVKSHYDKLDMVFNVAGIGVYKKLNELTIKEWKDSIEINLVAPLLITKRLLHSLMRAENPIVVNIGSGMGKMPFAGRTAYCASKFGLRGMSLCLSKEFEDTKLKVCLITLGSVMDNFGTGGLEMRKKLEREGKHYLQTEEVANNIIQAIKDEKILPEITMYPNGYET